jgi:NhaP-type Na+/H+ or K+/H+ antiporter
MDRTIRPAQSRAPLSSEAVAAASPGYVGPDGRPSQWLSRDDCVTVLTERPFLDVYEVALLFAGLAILGIALLPRLLAGRPLSYPIIYVTIGLLLSLLSGRFSVPDPLEDTQITERLAEVGVIVALMGAGLKLNRPPAWSSWSNTWRLLAVTMPLSIAATALLGYWVLGLAPAAAVLLGAALAPTDPVLAGDVQVEGPLIEEGEDDPEVRFSLTSEAGLNDGFAFPFTNAAIAMAVVGAAPGAWVGEWLLVDVVFRIAVGAAAGWVVGRLLSGALFRWPASSHLAETSEGVVVLAATLITYSVTQLLGGYGFLAVFISAIVIRDSERSHEYHEVLHSFSDQAERVLSALILLAVGVAIGAGALAHLGVRDALVVVLLILVIRPAAGLIGLAGASTPGPEKAAIAFFGIRGIGSIYYLAHGVNEVDLGSDAARLWSIVGATILASIFLHGVAASPWMKWLSSREDAAA